MKTMMVLYTYQFFYVYLPFSSITFLYGMTLMYKVTAIKIELQFTYPYKNIKMMVKVPIIAMPMHPGIMGSDHEALSLSLELT